jgi:two-component system response regulator
MASQTGVEILLIEDNPHDAEMAMRAFEKSRIVNRVHRVEDGAEALAFLFATGSYADRAGAPPPRLVLLDLKLPKVDGLEVLRRIKADERTRLLPIVVMTSSREERDIVDSYKLGVNSYIVKPVDFDKFVQAVEQLGLYWLLLNEPPPKPAAPPPV